MPEQIVIEHFKPGEENQAVDLVLSVFDQFVGPQYPSEGVAEFRKYVNVEALSERLGGGSFAFTAKSNGRMIGFIEVRDQSHVAMFFVLEEFQGRGVGRALMEAAMAKSQESDREVKEITVNSSPNSVDCYQALGFSPTSKEQAKNGMRFTPMAKSLSGPAAEREQVEQE